MENKIPLFPLNIVVFPFSRIPLHIFEERYKIMIGNCLNNNSGFGIISVLKDQLSNIGSYVKVTSVLNKNPNGEMDIVVKGLKRFKILRSSKHKDGYLVGEIEKYEDISNEFDNNLLEQLKINFTSILNKINFKLDDVFWENYKNSKLKSYKIAEKSGLNIDQQQKFLTLQKENDRIDYLMNHLNQLEKKLKENITTGGIIMGDGYL